MRSMTFCGLPLPRALGVFLRSRLGSNTGARCAAGTVRARVFSVLQSQRTPWRSRLLTGASYTSSPYCAMEPTSGLFRSKAAMKVETIRKGTKHLTMTEMPLKARVILEGMRGNPHFAGADALLDELEQKAAAMTAANIACLDGGRLVTLHRRKCRTELERVLDRLVGLVKALSHGDVAIALSSGFHLRKAPIPLPKPGPPMNLRWVLSGNGRVEVRWDPIHGTRHYVVFMNTQGPLIEEGWELIAHCSSAKIVLSDQEPGTVIWFRLFAVNAAGCGPLSQVVRCMAH